MKHPKLILCGALIAAIAITMLLFGTRQSPSIESVAVPSDPVALAAQPPQNPPKPSEIEPAPPALAAARPRAAARSTIGVESNGIEPARLMQVRTDQVLATVNNRQIQLKDLLALSPDAVETTLTMEQYHSRLNRAIEVELTFQAAQAQGVVLTADQRERLARIGRDHKARLAEYKQQEISWSSVTTPELEFERRLMSALMLQQNLVAKEAAVAPSPEVSVQARYEQASRDLLDRLKANAAISTSIPAL